MHASHCRCENLLPQIRHKSIALPRPVGFREFFLRRVEVFELPCAGDTIRKVLVEHVEPNLGQGRLTILFEYPAPEAALARSKPSDCRVAARHLHQHVRSKAGYVGFTGTATQGALEDGLRFAVA